MCTVTTYQIKPITYRRIRRYDPTRTTSLRNAFVRRMNGKFDKLGSLIKRSIVIQDVFGLKQKNMQLNLQANQLPGAQAFDFARSAEKLAAFNAWLEEQIKEGLLEVSVMQQSGVAIEDQWTNKYISDSYERGVQRARYEMKKSGMDIPGIDETGGIKASMSTPFHLDRVGLVGTRVYEDLRGITTQMSTQINRVLAQGLADGDNPLLLANKLVSTINGKGMGNLELTDTLGRFIPAKRRAQTLARTEIIRAHHQGTMQEYANWAVEGVIVQAEFMTAQDDRVCPSCEALEGVVMTLEDAKNVIPVHPNCRCIMLPVDKSSVMESKISEPEKPFDIEELPVDRNIKFDKEFIDYVNDDYGEDYSLSNLSARDINNGFCDDWANFYSQKKGGSVNTILDIVGDDAGSGIHGHTFIYRNGKYFDAEHFNGVDNISDLNFFRRAMKHNNKIYSDEFLLKAMFSR